MEKQEFVAWKINVFLFWFPPKVSDFLMLVAWKINVLPMVGDWNRTEIDRPANHVVATQLHCNRRACLNNS
jgi:hypothetical protein